MKKKTKAVAAFLIGLVFLVPVLFVEVPAFLLPTHSYLLEPKVIVRVDEGTRIFKSGIDVGYVRRVNVDDDGHMTINLCIQRGHTLDRSEVCVIHRLHRYDKPSIQIERTINDRSVLPDGALLNVIVANGPWPEIPGAIPERPGVTISSLPIAAPHLD